MSEFTYLNQLHNVRNYGNKREGRNGYVLSKFDTVIRYKDILSDFPLFRTKAVHFKSLMVELLWMIKGKTNIDYLHKHGVTIWDEWADENGDLGPVYGAQWRSWPLIRTDGTVDFIDQLSTVIQDIQSDPYSRRHIISAWNVSELDQMKLPPCHAFMQFYVEDDKLHLKLTQRSADMFLGVPFNVASYSLLLLLVARETGLQAGDFIHSLGDYHIYGNHLDAVAKQLSRKEILQDFLVDAPVMRISITDGVSIFDLEPEDIELSGYTHMGYIPAPVSK